MEISSEPTSTTMSNFSELFERYIEKFYYKGRIMYHAYIEVAQEPSITEFDDLKEWHALNKAEVNRIVAKHNSSVKKFRSDFDRLFVDWRSGIVPRLPTPDSIKYVGLFNTKGDS